MGILNGRDRRLDVTGSLPRFFQNFIYQLFFHSTVSIRFLSYVTVSSVVLNKTHNVCFRFCTKQPGKHEVPYKTAIQTASFETKQEPKQNLVLVFAAGCQPISNRANLLEV